MVRHFQHMIATYRRWSRNGFSLVLVFNKDKKNAIINLLQQYAPEVTSSIALHLYMINTPQNTGISKSKAYCILKQYLDLPNFQFAILLDDTVNEIINTYNVVITLAEESPIIGGTVAAKRHPVKCKQDSVIRVKAGFLQQALIFSCRGAPTLTKTLQDAEE